MPVERKYERDIDLLLAEEFAVAPHFAAWFLSHTRFASAETSVENVFVSRADSTGESDLVVVFKNSASGGRFAILIEDKIDAPLQPEQLQRYELRGQVEIARGEYEAFEVAVCAPEAYRRNHPELAGFSPYISYESIGKFLRENAADARTLYRADFITTAAGRGSSAWSKVEDAATSSFWEAAYSMAVNSFPALEMKRTDPTKDQTWVSFRPQDMPTRPIRIYVLLKGDRGFADLTFTACPFRFFEPLVKSLLGSDMSVHATGKSSAIRIQVPGFTIADETGLALERVRGGFAACVRLIEFYRANQVGLDTAVRQSISPSLRNPPPGTPTSESQGS